MAVKKSALYSSLWKSCDELRGAGGMDSSQYKDYVLTMLFVKYISDKAKNPGSLLQVPKGCSFQDMVLLKNNKEVGDRINVMLAAIFAANGLDKTLTPVDFNEDALLGTGKEKVDLLTKLIGIFENKELDFQHNRAEDDDILGDAYEYLMRHFATESGKSKGQFYTPSEVSRVVAKVVGAQTATDPTATYTAYDMTCGSGSLLLKVADEAPTDLSLYGQEKDISTRGLAIMNMCMHGAPDAEIQGGNTLSSPKFFEKDASNTLKRFDFCVANPPFSQKSWSSGFTPNSDLFQRFQGYGIPPDKNGDYAFLLHMLKSMKSTGKGAIILPHGVLFRGNAEAEVRRNLLERRLIKGIIGLPANLFYGTGIPACIIVLDKENTDARTGVFMIDASRGFVKDGNKNRLRERDIHQIVETFNQQLERDHYARLVPWAEIAEQDYNLNLPRYIDRPNTEDVQDLGAHLLGGIPVADVDALGDFWAVYPQLRHELFQPLREGYVSLSVAPTEVKATIYEHAEFKAYQQQLEAVFEAWSQKVLPSLSNIDKNTSAKALIGTLSQSLLAAYRGKALVNPYSIYQLLMDYWETTLKDDVYLVLEEGWTATVRRIKQVNKKGKETDKGWTCDLLPKELVIERYLTPQKTALQQVQTDLETLQTTIKTLEEEQSDPSGLLYDATNEKGTLSKKSVTDFIKAHKNDNSLTAELNLAKTLLQHYREEASLKKTLKNKTAKLDELALLQYAELTPEVVQDLLLHQKWLHDLRTQTQAEVNRISQRLTTRIQELAERYATTLKELDEQTTVLEENVFKHLEKMGFSWM